ncbi:MAG: acyl-CoA thioesterase, partial [Gammaproteobacteria bacterium]
MLEVVMGNLGHVPPGLMGAAQWRIPRRPMLIDRLLRLPAAFTGAHRVVAEEIDEYAHVNNTVYLRWLDGIAWAHSARLGLPIECCLGLRRGMAVRHTRADYLEAALLDDMLLLATWIVACDGRLRCTRRFEILRMADGKRVLEAEIDFFCLNLDTGKPCRFPREFAVHYTVMPEVAVAYAVLQRSLHQIGYPRGAV